MKRLHTHSQHFLRNPRFVRELVGHTSIKSTDIVYDIGAGSGVIASVLASRCRRVIAIEIEPKTAAILRKNMAIHENVQVKEGDFMTLALPEEAYKIFANIPFSLSSAMVHRITDSTHPPAAAYLIVQKQFANKLLPDHSGFSSQLGMQLGPRFAIRIRKRLKRTDFWPHPNVDTVLLEILPRNEPLIPMREMHEYKKFITRCFTTPTVFAALPLAAIHKEASVKPSSLTLTDWITLYQATRKS